MYDNSLHVNPSIRNFWRNLKKNDSAFHVFKHNRNMVFFGDSLSKASFEYIVQRLEKLNIQYDLPGISQAFVNLTHCEKGHTKTLKNLAIKAVSEALDIPEDLLEANLNEDSNVELNNSTENKNYDYNSLSQELKNQINKRILLNSIIQGSSIHSFYTLHHFVKGDIDTINPNLIPLYDTFAAGSVRSYYSVDYAAIVGNLTMSNGTTLGSVKVEYQDDKPKVVANAKSFPVLCQELVKGAMETICLHGLQNISKEDLEKIYYFADARHDEPRYIQIGSAIWRNILELNKMLRPNNVSIPELIMNISMMNPETIETFFEKLNEQEFEDAMALLDTN
jgi:hypothetical protein